MKITATLLLCFCICSLSAQEMDMIYTDVEQMPYFPSCETISNSTIEKRQCSNEALVSYISEHLRFPAEAKEQQVEGTVLVSFFIDKAGFVTEPYILRDIGFGCGEEALRVIRGMPQWEPGIHQGEPVKIKLNLPVHFAFKKTPFDETQDFTLRWGQLNGNTLSKKQLKEMFESNEKIFVWDAAGNKSVIDELIFSVQRKKSFHQRSSKGDITSDLKKIIRKVKKSGTFTILATVQQKGKFVYVRRVFEIVS